MTTDNIQTDASAKVKSTPSNLQHSKVLNFDEDKSLNRSKTIDESNCIKSNDRHNADSDRSVLISSDISTDINETITALDSDLTHLRLEIHVINSSVEVGLSRLDDNELDLTTKVSDTYKRLGEIANAYESLLNISSRIDNELQALNGRINGVVNEVIAGQVSTRINQLLETSRSSSEMIRNDIHSATKNMLQIENKVVSQIEDMSNASQQKAASLGGSVEQCKAKILKLQAVDEAIIRRATTLEITAAELTDNGRHMDSSIELLQSSSDVLMRSYKKLNERTVALEGVTKHHGVAINVLRKGNDDTAETLSILANRMNRFFNVTLIGFLLMIVLFVVILISQNKSAEINRFSFVTPDDLSPEVDPEPVENAPRSSSDSDVVLAVASNVLEKSGVVNVGVVQGSTKSVVDDSSKPGSVVQNSDDIVIHDVRWIAALPADNYILQLAYVDNKAFIYDIAKRYSLHQKGSLSYFVSNDKKRYILLSGNYASEQQVLSAIRLLPDAIAMRKPVVRKVSDVQRYISTAGR